MWELKGCPYCKETHVVNFAQSRIADYIKANFEITQLNIIGSLKVTDFDGTEMREKDLAAKYGVRYTPTFQFFGENPATLKTLPPQQREVSRTQGICGPTTFSPVSASCATRPIERQLFAIFSRRRAELSTAAVSGLC